MRRIAGLTLCLLLAACGGSYEVPVINKDPERTIPDAYEVRPGDSIYEIAWAFGVDYLDIAKWNKMGEPFRVQPGQVLYLREPSVKTTPLSVEETLIVRELPDPEPLPPPAPVQADTPRVTFTPSSAQWAWPAEGNLVGKYSPSQGRNGIQIAGARGSPVRATSAGEVVYVGEGLRGYGKLIIVKHSGEFLSAYAHNDTIQVAEGQAIQGGQQIATMGSSGAQSTMLHFEIRKDGKPVDPLRYLK